MNLQESEEDKIKKILLLYSMPRGGHKECADAIRKAFKALHPSSVRTEGIDTIRFFYPVLGPLIARTYLELLRYTPQIWDFLYDNPDIEEITRELRQLFNVFNASKLELLLERYRPDALVCTHAIPCGAIAEQKRRGNCKLPLIGIVTDYAVHSYWIYPEVDLYIVANTDSERTLISRGVSREKIRACGIPVNPSFHKKLKLGEARRRLGLDPGRPVILIMGGTHGIGPFRDIIGEVLAIRPSPQVLAVAGTNKDLEEELAGQQKTKDLRVFGHTDKIPNLMDASDLLITKPGGLTSSEALAKGLPMILVSPLPGQEERNARYLLKNGAAVQSRKTGDLKEIASQLLKHPERLRKMSEKCKNISKPGSAVECSSEILGLISNMRTKKNSGDFERQAELTGTPG